MKMNKEKAIFLIKILKEMGLLDRDGMKNSHI